MDEINGDLTDLVVGLNKEFVESWPASDVERLQERELPTPFQQVRCRPLHAAHSLVSVACEIMTLPGTLSVSYHTRNYWMCGAPPRFGLREICPSKECDRALAGELNRRLAERLGSNVPWTLEDVEDLAELNDSFAVSADGLEFFLQTFLPQVADAAGHVVLTFEEAALIMPDAAERLDGLRAGL